MTVLEEDPLATLQGLPDELLCDRALALAQGAGLHPAREEEHVGFQIPCSKHQKAYLCLHSCPDVPSESRHTEARLEMGLMSASRVGGVILCFSRWFFHSGLTSTTTVHTPH